jgi:hypothetical protein
MSNEVRVDYEVDATGTMRETESVKPILDRLREMERVRDLINAAWCGALIAGLFKQNEWLESFTLDLEATAEYDDSGGSYRSVSLYVRGVKARNGSELPESVAEGGSFVEDMAQDLLEQALEDENYEIYSTLVEEGVFQELSLSFERKEISDLLGEPELSGRDAFNRLFPNYVHLIETVGDRY